MWQSHSQEGRLNKVRKGAPVLMTRNGKKGTPYHISCYKIKPPRLRTQASCELGPQDVGKEHAECFPVRRTSCEGCSSISGLERVCFCQGHEDLLRVSPGFRQQPSQLWHRIACGHSRPIPACMCTRCVGTSKFLLLISVPILLVMEGFPSPG